MSSRIVITGEGIVSAIGIGKAATARSLRNRESGIGILHYLHSGHKDLPVGEVQMSNSEMKASLGIDEELAVSRTALLGMMAVSEAIGQAKVKQSSAKRILLISGTTVAGMDITEDRFASLLSKGATDDTLRHHDCGSSTADEAHHFDGLFADYTTISTACSSAANAIILGAELLSHGDADIVVAGGTEALSRFHLNGFNSLMILDHHRCRPFDSSRKGLNLGEGAAYLVMEREDEATKRGASIDAWLSGYGNACDAFHQTASSPDGIGAQIAMRQALEMSGLNTTDISWLEAHGTGTKNNDASEGNAIKSVFNHSLPTVSSTKAYTGHTTSASGSISAVIAIIALKENFIPASIGFDSADEGGIIPTKLCLDSDVNNVMVNAFGFGGNDSSLIFSRQPADSHPTEWNDYNIVEAARVENSGIDNLSELKQYVKPMAMRRMGKLMKSALLTSLRALEAADIEKPDAIVTATAWGCVANTEALLRELEEGEDATSPTAFMQSTHNTIGSTIAIQLGCHGFNTTISQGNRSMAWAMVQARLLLESGRCKTVLVGCHDETTPLLKSLLKDMGCKPCDDVHSVAVVLKREEKKQE